jgi:ferredoxin
VSLRVLVDPDVCIGAGNCVLAEPTAFSLDKHSVARLEPAADALDTPRLLAVARACPSGAVELFDGDQQVDIFSMS